MKDIEKFGKRSAVNHQKLDLINKETKTLNSFGKFTIASLYTVLIICFTTFVCNSYFENSSSAKMENINKKQIQLNQNMLKQLKSISSTLQYNPQSLNLEERLKKHINKVTRNPSKDEQLVIEKKDQEIYDLKQRVSELLTLVQVPNERKPASQILNYSPQNYDILYFKHRQILSKLKQSNVKKENAFISLYDMSQKPNQEHLKSIKDQLELEYYSKKRILMAKREQFIKEKFINLFAEN